MRASVTQTWLSPEIDLLCPAVDVVHLTPCALWDMLDMLDSL